MKASYSTCLQPSTDGPPPPPPPPAPHPPTPPAPTPDQRRLTQTQCCPFEILTSEYFLGICPVSALTLPLPAAKSHSSGTSDGLSGAFGLTFPRSLAPKILPFWLHSVNRIT